MSMRLIVTGMREHGKNTVCKILERKYGLKWVDSSWFACDTFLFDEINVIMETNHKWRYSSKEACHKDRSNWRSLWYQLIRMWNGDDAARMGKAIFANHDVYNGMRHIDELNANAEQHTYDFLVWVDAGKRKSAEDASSMSISRFNANYVLDNNGTEAELEANVDKMMIDLYNRLEVLLKSRFSVERVDLAMLMRAKFHKNVRKPDDEMNPHGGVRTHSHMPLEWFIERAEEELREVKRAIERDDYDEAALECADVANFMAFLLGKLKKDKLMTKTDIAHFAQEVANNPIQPPKPKP